MSETGKSPAEPKSPAAPGARPSLSRGDRFLLRWILLCLSVQAILVLLGALGVMDWLEYQQIGILCGQPFYMEAEAAQVSMLGPVPLFLISVLLCLYLGYVLLRQRSFGARCQIALPALLAITLPGLLCMLWDAVLPVGGLSLAVILLWLLSLPLGIGLHNKA